MPLSIPRVRTTWKRNSECRWGCISLQLSSGVLRTLLACVVIATLCAAWSRLRATSAESSDASMQQMASGVPQAAEAGHAVWRGNAGHRRIVSQAYKALHRHASEADAVTPSSLPRHAPQSPLPPLPSPPPPPVPCAVTFHALRRMLTDEIHSPLQLTRQEAAMLTRYAAVHARIMAQFAAAPRTLDGFAPYTAAVAQVGAMRMRVGTMVSQYHVGFGGVGDTLRGLLSGMLTALAGPMPRAFLFDGMTTLFIPLRIGWQPRTVSAWRMNDTLPAGVDWLPPRHMRLPQSHARLRGTWVPLMCPSVCCTSLAQTCEAAVTAAPRRNVTRMLLSSQAFPPEQEFMRPVVRALLWTTRIPHVLLHTNNWVYPSIAESHRDNRKPALHNGVDGDGSAVIPDVTTTSLVARAWYAKAFGAREFPRTLIPVDTEVQDSETRLQHALMYRLLDWLMQPSVDLVNAVLHIATQGHPDVNALLDTVHAAASCEVGCDALRSRAATAWGRLSYLSVLRPSNAQQYMISIHLRIGEQQNEGATFKDAARVALGPAVTAAVACAHRAAADLQRAFGPRPEVLWFIACDRRDACAQLRQHGRDAGVLLLSSNLNRTLHTDRTLRAAVTGISHAALTHDMLLMLAEHLFLSSGHAMVAPVSGFSDSAARWGGIPERWRYTLRNNVSSCGGEGGLDSEA